MPGNLNRQRAQRKPQEARAKRRRSEAAAAPAERTASPVNERCSKRRIVVELPSRPATSEVSPGATASQRSAILLTLVLSCKQLCARRSDAPYHCPEWGAWLYPRCCPFGCLT